MKEAPKLNKALGVSLKEFRKSKGYSMSFIASIFDINRQNVYNWEKGISPIPLNKLLAIMQTFNLSLHVIDGKILIKEE